MSPPRFRGDGEDWLDSEGDDHHEDRKARIERNQKRKKKTAESRTLDPSETHATVIEVFPNLARVLLDDPRTEILCTYRRGNLIGKQITEVRERAPVAVGDRVRLAAITPPDGVIEGLAPRRNELARLIPGRGAGKHVLVSNVDRLVIVSAATRPEFTPGLVDRFLVAARAQGIESILVVTKLDLLPKGGAKPWDFYRSLGLQVFELSLVDQSIGTPLPEILRFLEGFQRVVFAGHSGVGKTSLLKALTGQEVGATGDVNRETGKGRHTTTSARQIVPTSFVDTPGVKEFGLFDVQSDQLRYLFPEMASLECEAPSCLHVGEDGCEAEKLYRYESYRRIYDSLENL